jgi:hypothetical protein
MADIGFRRSRTGRRLCGDLSQRTDRLGSRISLRPLPTCNQGHRRQAVDRTQCKPVVSGVVAKAAIVALPFRYSKKTSHGWTTPSPSRVR